MGDVPRYAGNGGDVGDSVPVRSRLTESTGQLFTGVGITDRPRKESGTALNQKAACQDRIAGS